MVDLEHHLVGFDSKELIDLLHVALLNLYVPFHDTMNGLSIYEPSNKLVLVNVI